MARKNRCGSHMGRMLGININRLHVGHNSCKHNVPILGGIFVNANLHRAEYIYLGRKSKKCITKTLGHHSAFLGCA